MNVSALSVIKAAGYTHPMFERFIRSKFGALPKSFRPVVNERYISTFQNGSFYDANVMLRQVTKTAAGLNGLMASNDAELCAYAKKCAGEAYMVCSRFLIAEMGLHYLREYAKSKGIEPPNEKISFDGQRARLLCDRWWRRAIRKSIAREVEAYAIKLGLVNRSKCIYASDETVERRQMQKKRNRDLLKTVIAVNELGDEFTLEKLSELNTSNPKLRRMELMTRIAGFDEIAKEAGHVADFYTLTCPSKFHAIGHDGKPNKKFNGATPKEAQTHLVHTFAKLRAYLAKHGIKVYGFRVAEPHHDGTPHWHMILFYEKQYKQFVRDAVYDYWLEVDGDEFGASRVRSTVTEVDYSKGSAVGYLAKYISKNIDGEGLGDADDFEGGKVDASINRVEAWAACWGIRQFQQIGGAPVGVWREARRLRAVMGTDTGHLNQLLLICDGADWAGYNKWMGGVFAMRKDMRVSMWREMVAEARTLYDGYGMERMKGLAGMGEAIETRLHEWVLKRALAPAWSSVNNCNQTLLSERVKGGVNEKINHFVRQKPPVVFDISAGTGIKDDETIKQFDMRIYGNG